MLRLIGVNMWNYDIGMEEICCFFFGCGVEIGNFLSWFDLINIVDLLVYVRKLKGFFCIYCEGECVFVFVVVRKNIFC